MKLSSQCLTWMAKTVTRTVTSIVVGVVAGVVSSATSSSTAQAMPAQIVILRHAEKPSSGNELSQRGWDRARALPALFSSRAELTAYGAPVEVIGMSQKPHHSIRSVQTVSFLSSSLHLQTNTDYMPDDVDELVSDLSSDARLDGKTVVICWHRDNLPELIEAFGGPDIGRVPSNQYDRLWVLSMTKGHVHMQDLPQNVLPGDSAR